jgi:4-amino-4-deoxy-L-arabinose transferase-like glycosyltransferase
MKFSALDLASLRVSWGLFFAALLPRLYVAIAWAREAVWDGHYYDFGARRIAMGMGYSDESVIRGVTQWHPWCHYPVGYSAFLALFYRVFGAHQWVAPCANALMGALLVWVVHRLGLRLLTPVRALIAALLVAFSPELIAYSALLMTEPLASLGPLAAALWWLAYRSQTPWKAYVGAGVFLGLSTLVRPQTIVAAPALALLELFPGPVVPGAVPVPRATVWKKALLAASITSLCAIFVVFPWTIRNCRVMDGCAFVSTNAGWNLTIGSFPRATGRFETVRATDGCRVVTGQVQQDRCWMKVGLYHIRHEPLRYLSLIPKKLSNTIDHASFAMGYLGEANPQQFDEDTKRIGRRILGVGHQTLVVLAAFAWIAGRCHSSRSRWVQRSVAGGLLVMLLVILLRNEHSFWWFAALTPLLAVVPLPGSPANSGGLRYLAFQIAALLIIHAVFFGEDRYHIVITPVLALLAAAAFRTESPVPASESA